jgi:chemotaxis protein MotB
MSRKKKHPEHVNHERWLVSYADFITLLFAFFVVMFAVSQVDTKKLGRFTESFENAIGIISTPAGAGILPGEGELPEANGQRGGRGASKGEEDELAALHKSLASKAGFGGGLAGVKIVRRGNELVLRMDAQVLFDSGADSLREPALPLLNAIADELRTRNVNLRVEGHTDSIPITNGRYRSNWDLSAARAASVVDDLAKGGLMDPSRMAAVGYGEYQPLAPNDTPEGRAQNRRVDFVVTIRATGNTNITPTTPAN